jgi:hypothetical protein
MGLLNTLQQNPQVECYSGYTGLGRVTPNGIEVELWDANNAGTPRNVLLYK